MRNLGRPAVNQPKGLDPRANGTEWARLVCLYETNRRSGRRRKIYGDSTQPGVNERLDAPPRAARATICLH